jgi:hypothetical protein
MDKLSYSLAQSGLVSGTVDSDERGSNTKVSEPVHLGVDFKPIYDADGLLSECETFLEQAANIALTINIPGLAQFRQWRAKRRGK